MVDAAEQQRYWDRPGRRRSPDHPAVSAFARPKVEMMLSVLDRAASRPTLLEVGAGNGYFSVALNERFELTCLDWSQAMLDQNPISGARKVRGDAQALPVADRSYDYVFCGNLLHHLPNPQLAVLEMRRVARRGVLMIEPNARNPLMFAFSALKRAEWGALKFNAGYLKRLGAGAGLRLRAFFTHGSIVPNATPTSWVPLLRCVDVAQPLAFYHVAVFDV